MQKWTRDMDRLSEKDGWLDRRIREAQKEVESWPEWMQRAAHFEGERRD